MLSNHAACAINHYNLLSRSIPNLQAKTKEEIEMSLDCGLVKGHAYAVTAVRFIEVSKQKESIGAKIG